VVSVVTVLCAKAPPQESVEVDVVVLPPPADSPHSVLDGAQGGGGGQVWQGVVDGTQV
jgi:hypothetical protein